MTRKILFLTFTLVIVYGCDDDNPFNHFRPYREVPVLGKGNEGMVPKESCEEEETNNDR